MLNLPDSQIIKEKKNYAHKIKDKKKKAKLRSTLKSNI